MPKISKVGEHVQVAVDRLDGGRNVKDSPSRIADNESPDSINVVFDDQGSVATREGTSYYTASSPIATKIDGLTTFQAGTMVAWASGTMWRASGATMIEVTAACGNFTAGTNVGYEEYQGALFCSDGTNGPWRYEGDQGFYNMGIDQPTACTGDSDTSGGGDITADTYYHAVSFINTAAVEGEVGSASAGTTLGASASIDVSEVPLGTDIQGVAKRNVYRATSATGPWLFVKELSDNTTTSFSDNIGVGSEGSESVTDGTAPTPFQAIRLHKDRLFFPDSSNKTLLRYTNYTNPYISQSLSFFSLSRGDGSNIAAIGVQDDLVTAFKGNSTWLMALNDPADATTWQVVKSPANLGIVGLRSFIETNNGIIFLAKRNGYIAGFHFLNGIDVLETNNRFLRTKEISEKIESDILAFPAAHWAGVAMGTYKNRIYVASPKDGTSTRNDGMYWFDINRLGSEGQPGSWSKWTGDIGCTDLAVFDEKLYGGSSDADGNLLQFENNTYTDASGGAIDSYFWTKEFGGEAAIESWIKDWRWVNVWYDRLGSYNMNMSWRTDGGGGTTTEVDLTPNQAQWSTAPTGASGALELIWAGVGASATSNNAWASEKNDLETQHPVGPLLGRRIQVKFDNQNTAGQGFKVHSLKTLANLRRQR